jgi:hypothetical protein
MPSDSRVPGQSKRKMVAYECQVSGCPRIAWAEPSRSVPTCPVHKVSMLLVKDEAPRRAK